jgi:hypothetical protein
MAKDVFAQVFEEKLLIIAGDSIYSFPVKQGLEHSPLPEIIDPVFAKTSPKRSIFYE